MSAKIPRHSVIAAWGRLKFRAKVKAQRGAGRQGLLKGFDRLGNSTETKDDFRKSRKPGPEILAFKGAETQQILHARDDCREGSLIQIDVRSCFFPKEKGRSGRKGFAKLTQSQTHLFQKFLARVARPNKAGHQHGHDHADAYLFNSRESWLPGERGIRHPVAGHDHRGERAKQEGIGVFGISEQSRAQTDDCAHEKKIEKRLLLQPGSQQISQNASNRGADQPHDGLLSHGADKLREHDHKRCGQGPCRIGKSQAKGDEDRKNPGEAELDSMTNSKAFEDLFEISPKARSRSRKRELPVSHRARVGHWRAVSPSPGACFKKMGAA